MSSIEDMINESLKAAQKINEIVEEEMELNATKCVSDIKLDTPVGIYPEGSGRTGGTLRRSMTHSNIVRIPGGYSVTIGSAISYCQAVEEGHKQTPGRYVPAIGKRLKRSFVPGKHMIHNNVTRYQDILNNSIKARVESEV